MTFHRFAEQIFSKPLLLNLMAVWNSSEINISSSLWLMAVWNIAPK